MVFVLYSFAHFLALYVYFHKCPPANGQTPKLVEIVSFKALFLNLVFVCYDFMRVLAVDYVS